MIYRRRLSLRQAIACEMGHGGYPSRCRCDGTRAGARRIKVQAKPTRWDFAALPVNDPHHIPAQRRRISPRNAVRILADQAARLQASNPAAAKTLRAAQAKVSLVVRDERVKIERQRDSRLVFSGELV